ncbi:hypothetical protein SDC9_110310 [bioreactor metagenome]|uniref:Uncharacterized protein n=1 Tax=bioreactor metagenome TaxID=1076179 RepID=A0A645BD85_9ZZZZ
MIQNNIFYSDFKSGDTYQGGRWDAIDIKTKTVQNLFSECSDGQLFTNNSFKNNIIYRKSGQYSIYLNGGWYNIDNIATTDKNNTYESFIKSDPLFVDAAGGNFTLSENSPALSGASENEYTPTYGYGHNQRSASSFGIN